MHKYLVFDLDGTLAPVEGGIPLKCVDMIRELQSLGYNFMICSGKSTEYILGLLRQVQIENTVIISENGSDIYYGHTLPPKKYIMLSCPGPEQAQIDNINRIMHEKFGAALFHQRNRIVLNPIPLEPYLFDELDRLFEENKDDMTGLIVHKYVNCYDILPRSINKKAGLMRFALEENADRKDFICIGDSVNDIPMFEFADMAIGVNKNIKDHTDHCFDGLEEALDFLIRNKP